MKKVTIIFILVLGSMFFLNGISHAADTRENIDICTYSVGSIQYIWSAKHAQLINKYSKKYRATAAFCGAETATHKLLGSNKTDIGESTAMEFEYAKRGEELYKKYGAAESKKKFFDPLAQIWHMPYGAINFFVLADSPVKTLSDFKGKKGSLSSAACTVGPICFAILKIHGLEQNKDYTSVHYSCGSGQAPDALADRTLDFFECNNPGRQPSVENIHVQNKVKRVSFAPGKLKEFLNYMDKTYGAENHGLYTLVVPKGTYGPNDTTPGDLENVAYDLIMTTRKDKSEDMVYEYLKALFDHLDEFYEIGAYSQMITLKGAVEYLHSEMPMHPGAARYFYEKGVLPKAFYKDLPADIKAKLK